MSETSRLGLPLLAQSQAQKHITHNQALLMLDMLAQSSVKASNLSAPPNAPLEGDCYLIASGASAEWLGKDNHLAYWTGQAWLFAKPSEGWLVWDQATDHFLCFDGEGWKKNGHLPAKLSALSHLGIQTNPNDVNRLSVKSEAALFSHDDITPGSGNMQVKVNKKDEAASATFLFQSAWSGRAEIGLAGNDDFSFKTSPDGTVWKTALKLSKQTGLVEFPSGAKASAPLQMAQYLAASLPDATAWSAGMVLVSDAPGGARLAYSDGAVWRWCHDLTPVS